MTWAKVTSLICTFWSLPWTNGPTTQFKWKLIYSPIQCAYLKSSINDITFRSSTHQNWPRDWRLTQSCWCLHWFLGFRAEAWQMHLHVYTRLVVTQVWMEKRCNKNIEIGFQSEGWAAADYEGWVAVDYGDILSMPIAFFYFLIGRLVER